MTTTSVLVWNERGKGCLEWQGKSLKRLENGRIVSPVWHDEVGFLPASLKVNVGKAFEVVNGDGGRGMTLRVSDGDVKKAHLLMRHASPSNKNIRRAIDKFRSKDPNEQHEYREAVARLAAVLSGHNSQVDWARGRMK
jgi:hypothetical protein